MLSCLTTRIFNSSEGLFYSNSKLQTFSRVSCKVKAWSLLLLPWAEGRNHRNVIPAKYHLKRAFSWVLETTLEKKSLPTLTFFFKRSDCKGVSSEYSDGPGLQLFFHLTSSVLLCSLLVNLPVVSSSVKERCCCVVVCSITSTARWERGIRQEISTLIQAVL